MVSSREEYWSRLSFTSPGDRLNTGIEPTTPELAGKFLSVEPLGKLCVYLAYLKKKKYLVTSIQRVFNIFVQLN